MIKFAKDIIKEIEKRGPIKVKKGTVASDGFEKWLIEESKKTNKK